MTKTKLWAVILMVLCTIFTASAQLLYKSGVHKLEFSLVSIISNWNIILGIVMYGLGAICLIVALRGGQLTVLYPIAASSYVWVALGSGYFFGEIVNKFRWIGIIFIMIGIVMIALNEKKTDVVNVSGAV